MHSALVMQDRETDSYWAIMTGDAVAGEFKGTELKELPVGEKAQWKDWLARHPNTVVLSVNGREDVRHDPYQDYFESPRGFRNTEAQDRRLPTKAPIFAFRVDGTKYAVPHAAVEGGKVFELNEGLTIFLYREPGAEMFASTYAFLSESGFRKEENRWVHEASGCVFKPEEGVFEGSDEQKCPERMAGLDTFWYTWSLTNPGTRVLK